MPTRNINPTPDVAIAEACRDRVVEPVRSAERMLQAHGDGLAAICRGYHVCRLELFGSAAFDEQRPGESDLDFLVEFETLSPASYADTYFGLMEALAELFGRPVDLVVASTVRNPYFRADVERTKTMLYAA